MSTKIYGYMRVSTLEQNEDRQLIELQAFGVPLKNTYMDKLSGKDFNRPQYQKMRKKIKEGDLIVVKSIDRLGRDYKDILDEWRYITKEKNGDIVILDMPILDTRRNKDLIGTLIADIVLQLLSYVAQVERENIRQRQAEGIAAARLRGVHLGRVAAPMPEWFAHAHRMWKKKIWSVAEICEKYDITMGHFYWLVKKNKRLRDRETK